MALISKFLGTVALISGVYSHSWLHCSDYSRPEELNGEGTFVEDSCNGYIREWQTTWGATSFATDRGINYQAGGPNWCQTGFSSDIESMYDDGYPPASWDYGQTVTLVWPAKNHANYECSSNIPDTSMKLYYNTNVNPTSEPGGNDVTDEWTLLIDWQEGCQAESDGCGFQNCPNYCSGTGGATCFQQYTVSQDDFPQEGYYTLLWYWIFNRDTTPYTTCFEVYITGEGASSGDDTDDDGSGGNKKSESFDDFIIQIPIFMTGATYDEDLLLDTAATIDIAEDTVIGAFDIIDLEGENTQNWNVTIQTETNNAGDVYNQAYDYADNGYSDLCTKLEAEFGTGTCRIDPGIIEIYGESKNNANRICYSDLNKLLLAIIPLFAYLLR